MFYLKICHWLDSNSGHLVLEATTLPTELYNHSNTETKFKSNYLHSPSENQELTKPGVYYS